MKKIIICICLILFVFIVADTSTTYAALNGRGERVGNGGGGNDPAQYPDWAGQTIYNWTWTGERQADGSVGNIRIGNWTSGDGSWSGGGGGAVGGGVYTGPMCIVGGCTTCSKNVYEPCPTTTTTTVLPPYVPPIQPDDTPGIGTSDPTAPSVSLYVQKQGDSGWTVNTTGKASDQVSLRWVTARANYCQSTNTSYFSVADTTGVSGSTNTVEEQTTVGPTGRRTYTIECRNSSGTTVRDSVTYTIVTDPLEFTAAPKLIRSKETSKLIWNVHGRTGCTVANKANDTDKTTVSTDTGSRDTVPLTGETTYRISCPDGSSADATIQVLPVISET